VDGDRRRKSVSTAVALLAFPVLSLLSIALANGAGSWVFWLYFIPQFVACFWVGWALRDFAWIEGGLALVPVLLAIPFGVPEEFFEEGPPLELYEALLVPINLALLIGGTVARRVIEGRAR
jgi:hypothetical protein